ncbi:NAD-dependent epimerase/dehydratase family protein [Azospirillum doebereinerae]
MTTNDLGGLSCVVLGGGGFIGSNLCQTLVGRGARVTALGQSCNFPEAMQGVTWVEGSFSDRDALARVVEGSSVVFHLIGGNTPESSNRDPVADLMASTVNTLHLLEICRTAKVGKIVFVSSGGTVYGIPDPARVPIPETAPTDPISGYGISKLTTEKYLGLYRHLHGLDSVVLRVANPFGRYQLASKQQGVIAALVQKALAGETLEIWGTGDVVRDFIHIDDVVDALIGAVRYDGPSRVLNVGSGVGRSINTIIADLETILDRGPLPKVYKPGRPADVPVNVLDIGLIREEMGWAPRTDWMEGLRATVDWIWAQQTAGARP